MKTFHDFCEHAYSIDKRPCPDGYKWTKKYVSCVPKGSRWKIYGTYWGGVGYGRDESEGKKNGNGNGNGSHNGNGNVMAMVAMVMVAAATAAVAMVVENNDGN